MKFKNRRGADSYITFALVIIIILSITALGLAIKTNQEITEDHNKLIKENIILIEENESLYNAYRIQGSIFLRQMQTIEEADLIIRQLIERIQKLEQLNRLDINKIT